MIESGIQLVEFTSIKNNPVWVNPQTVTHVWDTDDEDNGKPLRYTQICLTTGRYLNVTNPVEDVINRLNSPWKNQPEEEEEGEEDTTPRKYAVGDYVLQQIGTHESDSRWVRVTERSDNIKHGDPGFFGREVEGIHDPGKSTADVWGYDTDIIRIHRMS